MHVNLDVFLWNTTNIGYYWGFDSRNVKKCRRSLEDPSLGFFYYIQLIYVCLTYTCDEKRRSSQPKTKRWTIPRHSLGVPSRAGYVISMFFFFRLRSAQKQRRPSPREYQLLKLRPRRPLLNTHSPTRHAPPNAMVVFFITMKMLTGQPDCPIQRHRQPTMTTPQHD